MQVLNLLAACGLAVMMLGGFIFLLGVMYGKFGRSTDELDGGYLP